MIQGISGGASAAQSAIEAALKAHATASKRIEAELANAGGAPPSVSGGEFTKVLGDGMRTANAQVGKLDALPSEMIAGNVTDFHQIAAQIKQSELTFKFALEVRNKLIDAYRETMRMSV